MRVKYAINMCTKYKAIECEVNGPKMVSRETRPVWMKWVRWLMNSACCTFWLKKTPQQTQPQTCTHATQRGNCYARRKNDQRKRTSLSPLSHSHHFSTTEPLSAPSGRGGLTRLDWVDPGATTTLVGSESLSDLEYKISGSVAFMSFSFTGFHFFQLNLICGLHVFFLYWF